MSTLVSVDSRRSALLHKAWSFERAFQEHREIPKAPDAPICYVKTRFAKLLAQAAVTLLLRLAVDLKLCYQAWGEQYI